MNAGERRCKATNRRGERCAARVVNAAGYCVAHDPEKPADMRALGKRSAEARRRPNPARVHPGLRDYLRENVSPAEVWQALKLALEGANESARVSASRVLMDALAEGGVDGRCPHCAMTEEDRRSEAVAVRAKLDRLIETRTRPRKRSDHQLEHAVSARTAELQRERDEAKRERDEMAAKLAEFVTE